MIKPLTQKPIPSQIGSLFSDTFVRGTLGANYTNVLTTGTINITSNKLHMTGGDSSFNNYSKVTGVSAHVLEEWVMTREFKGTTTAGFATWLGTVGIQANNPMSIQGFLNINTGVVGVYANGTLQVFSGGGQAISSTDSLRIIFQRTATAYSGFQYIMTAYNLTQSTSTTITYTVNPLPNVGAGNLGYFAVGTYAGTTDDTLLTVTSTAWNKPDYMFVGHSIVGGYNEANYNTRFASNIFANTNWKTLVYGSGSALIADFQTNIQGILDRSPKNVILMLGTNELILGTAQATITANYQSLRNALRAAGINVIHFAVPPSGNAWGSNVAACNTAFQGVIGSDLWIDLYTALLGSGSNPSNEFIAADLTHMNEIGHAKIQLTAQTSIGIPISSYDVCSLAYYNRCNPKPSVSYMGFLNTMVAGMRSDGDLVKLDELWVEAADANQQNAPIGLVMPKFNSPKLTEIATPTWTAQRGYALNGSTQYLKTGKIPSTTAVNGTQNSYSIFMYCRTNLGSLAIIDYGSNDGTRAIVSYTKWNDAKIYSNMNDFTAASVTTATDAGGLTMIQRTASNNINFYRRGILLGNTTTASVGLPTVEAYIGANNVSGAPANFSTRQQAITGSGSGTISNTNFEARITTFLTAIGANV